MKVSVSMSGARAALQWYLFYTPTCIRNQQFQFLLKVKPGLAVTGGAVRFRIPNSSVSTTRAAGLIRATPCRARSVRGPWTLTLNSNRGGCGPRCIVQQFSRYTR